ncbi:MAG: DUF1571 domain-containing protein [Fulvivirga sp.]|nr:DUF1571 domain-containing protein [Fulvivirga sp.]
MRLFTAFVVFLVSLTAQSQDAVEITQQMFSKTKEIKTLTYTMIKKERLEDEMMRQVSEVKLQRKPFKVYTRQLSPDEGLEVLYHASDKTALINPNGFPWINIRLDPFGSRMTSGQHHTILDSGFDRFVNILEHLFKKYAARIDQMAQIKQVTVDGRDYWQLNFNNSQFDIIDYTVKPDDHLLKIGHERHLSAYMVVLLNDDVDDYHDIESGQVIKIPNDYSPKMELLIDQELMVPVEIKVYFRNELFEHYQFSRLDINPDLQEDAFSSKCEDYGF